jgi:hypothetical protein
MSVGVTKKEGWLRKVTPLRQAQLRQGPPMVAQQGTRVFNSSLTSRRFPALRTLTAEDVEVMVMPAASPSSAAKKAAPAEGVTLDANVGKPTALGSLDAQKKPAPAAAARRPQKERPPFRPCNPKEARDTITERAHGYVGLHSPYDLAHKLQMLEREQAHKLVIGGAYNPNAWSKARKALEINYYLNSPDAETLEAERRYIQDKAQRNMVEYYRRLRPGMN